MRKTLRIGTRSSRLALWQAQHIQDLLQKEGHGVELVEISTQGDQNQSSPFSGMSGSGFFTKAIEDALLAEKVDIAVHSHKDLETTPTPGTRIAAIPARAEPNDLLLVHPSHYSPDPLLPIRKGGKMGTSSPRRQEQVRMFRSDLEVEELRGNVPTRLQKLREEKYSAILLAKAGIDRLEEDVSEFRTFALHPERFIPAPAQGALAVQIREEDAESEQIVKQLHQASSAVPCWIERGILQRFRGGCQLPLGAYCREEEDRYRVWGMVLLEGHEVPRRLKLSFDKESEGIADRVARKLQSEDCQRVFISKDLPEDHWWVRSLAGNGNTVSARSLIQQERIMPERIPETAMVFFSSRNAIRFFMEYCDQDLQARTFAVYGPGTAETLAEYGVEADFVGSGGPEEVAHGLIEWLEEKKAHELLVPGPEEPSRKIPDTLRKKGSIQVHELAIYRSIPQKKVSLPLESDTLVFTSPSNVRAFKEMGGKVENERVLAIGPSTQEEIQRVFPKCSCEHPEEPGLLGLLDLFFSKLTPKGP